MLSIRIKRKYQVISMKHFFILSFFALFSFNNVVFAQLNATIIGSGSPQFNPERTGPSVLINYKDTNIIVDTGNGTQARLNELGLKIKELDGIFYTHQHLDHNEEFIPIFIRSLLGDNNFLLVGPPPMKAMQTSTLAQYKTDIEYRMRRSGRTLKDVMDNFTVSEVSDKSTFSVGEIRVSTTKVKHTIDTIAYRFDAGGDSIVISGDLTYSESLSVLAKDAGVLIIESGGTIKLGARKRNKNKDGSSKKRPHQRAHVTLDETARMAQESGAKKIVLTHFTVGENDEPATIKELRKTYSGEIVFGSDLMIIDRDSHKASNKVEKSNRINTVHSQDDNKAALRAAKISNFTIRPTNPCTVQPEFENMVSISQDESARRILSNAIPDHDIGSFPNSGNPNRLSEQNKSYSVTLMPKVASQITTLYDRAIDHGRPNYLFGVALNGVKFEPMANEYFYGANGSNYDWTVEALSKEVFLGDDCNNAHIQPNGEYHYHGSPIGLINNLVSEQSTQSMILVGWAADGFPIYYALGYVQANDLNSPLRELKPSYKLREGQRPGDGKTAPNGEYSGLYVRDYVYVDNSGDLDQCNGRQGVTPEYPNGTYYYVLTNEFPFIGRCLVGEPSPDFKVGGGARQSPANETRNKSTQNKPDPKKIMSRMDKNGDEKISQSEASGRLKENFARRDKNRDGFIDFEELSPRR